MKCPRCGLPATIPDIRFGNQCSYCDQHDASEKQYPISEEEYRKCIATLATNKCLVGLSGGVDSSYLLWLLVQEGIKPLVVTVDGGWDTKIAQKNVKKLIFKFGLEHIVVKLDYDVVNDLQCSFIRAGVIDIDCPDDIAIKKSLYDIAKKRGIKYIVSGSSFRTEGQQPREWSFIDGRYLLSVHKKYGRLPLGDFPVITVPQQALYHASGIKILKPLNYIHYIPMLAKGVLEKLGWKDYGGKHYENIYTKFVASFWCYKKFDADKRAIEFAALVRDGQMTLQEMKLRLSKPPYEWELEEVDKLTQKLGMEYSEFLGCLYSPNKTFHDFKNDLWMRTLGRKIVKARL